MVIRRRLLAILTLCFAFSLTVSLLAVTAQAESGTHPDTVESGPPGRFSPPGPYLSLPSIGPMPLEDGIPPGDGPWVVRAHYPDRTALEALAAWNEPWEVDRNARIVVLQVDAQGYAWLLANGFTVSVDWALTNRLSQPNVALPDQTSGIPGYPCYRTVEETYATAEGLVAAYPNLATWIDIGDSWEKVTPGGAPGYDLMVLRLTNSAIKVEKPAFFVMASVHAREYTPAELVTRFAEYLVENYNRNADVTWLLDYYEIHLLLQANPDGRKQAETGISWRKNTNENYCSPTSIYRGADLNRNFSFEWGCCGGSSGSECSEVFRGPSPASEPETQAIENYTRSLFPDRRADDLSAPAPADTAGVFLDVHSYSELVLWSWGFTYAEAPNGTALQTLGRKLAYFNGYTPDQAIGLYPTDGTTDDFAYGELGVAAYTFELGTNFFQDCATFENVILPDNLEALLYAARVLRAPYLIPAGPDVLNMVVNQPNIPTGMPLTLTAVLDDTRYNQTNGYEATQNISAAEYTLDLPPWDPAAVAFPLGAADGAFNEKNETVQALIDTTLLNPARHTVYVRGQDASGNWGPVSALFFTTTHSAPVAAFTSNSPVYLGQAAQFDNQTFGSLPITYSWDFGDGLGSSDEADPAYIYSTTGTYTVTLQAENAFGAGTAEGTLQVLPCEPFTTVDFSQLSPDPLIIGLPVQVRINPGPVTGTVPYQYTLDWNDSSSAAQGLTSANPLTLSHVYTQPGIYTPTLSLANYCTTPPLTATLTMSVTAPLGVAIGPLENEVTGLPGETVIHSLRVTNTGTLPDSFAITLNDYTWPSQAPLTTPMLSPNQGTLLQVSVTLPFTATAGNSDSLVVAARSLGDPTRVAYASLTTSVALAYGLELTTPLTVQTAYPGTTISYTLRLSNTGTTHDAYTLTLDLSGTATGWNVNISTASGALAAGESLVLSPGAGQNLWVTVTVPPDALNGAVQQMKVGFTSQGDEQKSAVLDLVCRTVYHPLYIPVLPKVYPAEGS